MSACGHDGWQAGCVDCESEMAAAVAAMDRVASPVPLEGLDAVRVGPDDVLIVMLDPPAHPSRPHELDVSVAGMRDALVAVGLGDRSLVVVGPGVRFGVVPRTIFNKPIDELVHAIDCDLDEDCTCQPDGGARVDGD